jgi:exopolysaccharide biosynthesis polyprenyl glycosylphosphotransferase
VGFALIAALYWADHQSLPRHLDDLLAEQFTINNLFRAIEIFSLWALLMKCLRVYASQTGTTLSEALRISAAVGTAALFLAHLFGERLNGGVSGLRMAAAFGLFCLFSLCGIRITALLLSRDSPSGASGKRRVLIVGTGPQALRIFRYVRTELYSSHSLLGFIDSANKSLTPGEVESLFLGTLSTLETILLKNIVDEVIIALPARSCYPDIEETVEICARVGVEVKFPNDLFPGSAVTGKQRDSRKEGEMIALKPAAHDSRLIVKRVLDIVFAALALVVLSPLMLLIALLIKADSSGPVFFCQDRYGLGRRRFRMFKFRTMVVDAEAKLPEVEVLNEATGPIFKVRNDPRITRVGAFLRRSSLDELPQFMNVLLGDMSLVGPRPMSVRDVSLFTEAWLMRRFSVKPGLTCIWQVSGRSNTTFSRWMELDLHYIDHWSLGLDAKILAQTIPAVLKGSGAM